MISVKTQSILTFFIAIVWFINGLFCKILNLVPRHEKIVERILIDEYSRFLTILIGLSEVGMTLWILSGYRKRLNTMAQMTIVATMNIIEYIVVPDLLLWGKLNIVFAGFFILLIYYNEFVLNKDLAQQT